MPLQTECKDCHQIFMRTHGPQKRCKQCQKTAKEKQCKNSYEKRKQRLKENGKWKEYIQPSLKKLKDLDTERRTKVIELIGNKCKLCGQTSITDNNNGYRLFAFEIHGRPHSYKTKYIIEHYQDFVPLCYKCARGSLFCMKVLGISWKDIIQRRLKKDETNLLS